jgi:esterase/lipase superfamily enzyme
MGGRGENWAAPSCGRLPVTVPRTGAVGPDKKQLIFATIGPAKYTIEDCAPPDPDQAENEPAPLEKFLARMVAETGLNCVMLYVHGYGTGFDSAITRAAQLSRDVSSRCIPLAFSWSSAGQVDRYVSDVEHSSYAVPLFRTLLTILKQQHLRIDLVAHSMGTRLTLQTLVLLRRRCETAPMIDEMILAAPDIGAEKQNDDFATLMGDTRSCARRTTIYVSANDSVLAASQTIHGGIPRAGRDPVTAYAYQSAPGDQATFANGTVDVIDADDAPGDDLGHGYFAVSYEAISDIAQTLNDVPSLRRTAPSANYPATLGCGLKQPVACDPQAPRYRLIVAEQRRQRPSWLRNWIRSLIPLRPGE